MLTAPPRSHARRMVGTSTSKTTEDVTGELLRLVQATFLGLFLLLSLGLLTRRLVATTFQPLDAWALISIGLLLAFIGWFGRLEPAKPVARRSMFGSTPSLRLAVLLLMASAVTVRGSSIAAIVVLWSIVFISSRHDLVAWDATGCHWWQGFVQRLERSLSKFATRLRGVELRVPHEGSAESNVGEPKDDGKMNADSSTTQRSFPMENSEAVPYENTSARVPDHCEVEVTREALIDSPDELSEMDSVLGEGVDQQWQRGVDESGVPYCSGRVRLLIDQGQRLAHWHAVVCPAFGCLPKIDVEVVEGYEANLEVAQVLRHGWRVDVKLPSPAPHNGEVVLEFYATAPGIDDEVPDSK